MQLSSELEAALSVRERLDDALVLTIQLLNAETGTIHLLGEDGALHLRASSGIPDVVLNLVRYVPVGKGMAGLAVERREPVSICNIQTDSSGDVRPGAKQTGMEGAIVVPILNGDSAVGALGVANRAARTFTEEEIAFLMDVGRRLGAAVPRS